MATFKENLVLSKISYNDFKIREIGQTIGDLLNKEESTLSRFINRKENAEWKADLETIKDWKLINYRSNTKSGFSGVALMKPNGEIVIACRGTEPTQWQTGIPDIKTDALIYLGFKDEVIAQCKDAQEFVCETMGVESLDQLPRNLKLSFTGHSLGGGLAQYLGYQTRKQGFEVMTFNAVGIGQCLSSLKVPWQKYPQIKNYGDEWDIIFNSGIHLGKQIFIRNDERLKGPDYPPMEDYIGDPSDLLRYIKNEWNDLEYQIKVKFENVNDFYRYIENVYKLGTAYSHDLGVFRNDCDAKGNFYTAHRVKGSDVAFAKAMSWYIYIRRLPYKISDSIYENTVKKIFHPASREADQKKEIPARRPVDHPKQASEHSAKNSDVNDLAKSSVQASATAEIIPESGEVEPKGKPDDGFKWPKTFSPDYKPIDFKAIALRMKRDNLGQSLGYKGFDDLVRHATLCGEKNGVKFYTSEDLTTGKMVMWNDKTNQPMYAFSNRQELAAVQPEKLQQMMEQEVKRMEQTADRGKGLAMGMG